MGADEPPALSPMPTLRPHFPCHASLPRTEMQFMLTSQAVLDPAGGLGVATPCFISDCGRLMHRLNCSRHRRRWLPDLATPRAAHRKDDAISDCTHS